MAYKKEVEAAASDKGYKSTSDYAKDCISKDMYNKYPPEFNADTTNVIHPTVISEPKTEYTGTTLSRAQVLEKYIAHLERQSELEASMGNTAAALEISKEASMRYKDLLIELGFKKEEPAPEKELEGRHGVY